MTITYRVPGLDEYEAFITPVLHGFGDPAPSRDVLADERLVWEQPRSIGVLEGDRWIGGTGTFTMDLTVPGGAAVPAAGVTMVGVAPTHRRRGILTELVRRQLDDIAAGPEPIAMLTATESLIYGRFGYGMAARGVRLKLDPARGALRRDVEAGLEVTVGGSLRVIGVDEARRLLPDAYDRVRVGRPGTVRRWEPWWEANLFLDREHDRNGGGSRGYVVHVDDGGEVDGWASYRMHGDWPDRLPAGRVVADDVWAVDDRVRLAMWRVLLSIDLSVEVDVVHAPLDDPMRWALADPRRLRWSEVSDWLWLRLLDVPAALSPRRWSAAGGLVIEVVDPFRPASGGRFAIEAGSDGDGEVVPTTAGADLVMGAEEIASLALGTVSASSLARIGRIDEAVPGALATADALFRSDVEPYCSTMF